jgi:hypothetical protein
MHKIMKNTRFGNVKLGFYCILYDFLENKHGCFGAEKTYNRTKTDIKHKLLGLETCGLILHILAVAGCVCVCVWGGGIFCSEYK